MAKPAPSIDHDRLRELYVKKGMSIRQIAKYLGFSYGKIHTELGRAGVTLRSRARRS